MVVESVRSFLFQAAWARSRKGSGLTGRFWLRIMVRGANLLKEEPNLLEVESPVTGASSLRFICCLEEKDLRLLVSLSLHLAPVTQFAETSTGSTTTL